MDKNHALFHYVRNLEDKDSSPLWTQEDRKPVLCLDKKGNVVGETGK